MNYLKKIEIKSLNTCLKELKEEGFMKYFSINENGLHEMNSGTYYKPGEFKVSNLFNIKGADNRTDNLMLYAIETSDGVKGILSNAFTEMNNI